MYVAPVPRRALLNLWRCSIEWIPYYCCSSELDRVQGPTGKIVFAANRVSQNRKNIIIFIIILGKEFGVHFADAANLAKNNCQV